MNRLVFTPRCLGLLLLTAQLVAAEDSDRRAMISPDNPNLHVRGGLKHLKQQLEGGETCRIAFLGGSITENASGHSAMLPALLKSKFPDAQIAVTNAGWSSTCSTSGAFRIESQVLAGREPDLLVVEFAVNDHQDAEHARRECIRGMEGIIRRVRRNHPACGVVMVHYVNPAILAALQRGETPVPIAAHEEVAERYGVISVNVAAEVADAIRDERYTWDDYGGTHPGRFGYEVASNMIMAAIEAGMADSDGRAPTAASLPDALDAASYDQGEFVDPAEAQLGEGWKIGKVGRELLPLGGIRRQYEKFDALRSDVIGSELVFEFAGRSIGAFVLAGPDAGVVEVSVDGDDYVRHDLYHRHSGGLNYPRSVLFASDLPRGKHELKLRISAEKNPKSKGRAAVILFFEVNR